MAATPLKKIVIIGGTGAQGVPIVKGQYTDDSTLRKVFDGAYGAYREEVYWGMRIFEVAAEMGVRHYVWGALDYSLKVGGYEKKFRCGHYDGKGKVTDFLLAQRNLDIVPSVLTTGPYLEMLLEGMFTPKEVSPGKIVFNQPLGFGGKIPMIALDDIGVYALWIFTNIDKSAYLDLKVATAHIDFTDIVQAFNKVNPTLTATHVPVTIQAFLDSMNVPRDAPLTSVFMSSHPNSTRGLTFHENFTGFWELWNANVVKRDYELLDKIHPGRMRSVEEWMKMKKVYGEGGKGF
ncbi:hypothetical protein BC829DRAFT_428062 [Chytridium lagenaria]|nr:hypothetical protein BC829DRAFT_428062 [Chytridium lagenaria]